MRTAPAPPCLGSLRLAAEALPRIDPRGMLRPDSPADPFGWIWIYMGLVGLVLAAVAALTAAGMLGEPGPPRARPCIVASDCGTLHEPDR